MESKIEFIMEMTALIVLFFMSCQDVIRKAISKSFVCVIMALGIGCLFFRKNTREELFIDIAVALMLVLALVAVYICKISSIGNGDVWVMLALLFVLGGGGFFIMISICMFLVMLFSIGIFIFKKVPKNYQIPFIPFLTIGTFICLIVKR